MKKVFQNDSSELLVLLQSCHSIIGTAWSDPVYPELADSRIFIGTKLFISLENGAAKIDALFKERKISGSWSEYTKLWQHCYSLIRTLHILGNKSNNPNINCAFNLLFLATGVIYNKLSNDLFKCPKQDIRFSTVYDIELLMKKCLWVGNIDKIIEKLDTELLNILGELNKDT
jgi:hypothetical protein